jgi:hypothetical protein
MRPSREGSMKSRHLALMMVLVPLVAAPASAQWINYRAPGAPRLPDGNVNLSAPTPRALDGHPDLTGVWSGAGPMYRFNIAQDLQPGDVKPWAEALFLQRLRDSRKDSPLARCLPVSVPYHNFFNLTQFVQTPGMLVMMYESPNSPHRRIYTDGRPLPSDPNPAWFGYSVGRWEGDTLVVTTAGFNDRAWLDSAGHPQTETLRLTERIRRRDYGHMDFEMTLDDPAVFTKPLIIKTERVLTPDTDVLEDFCENEKDQHHFSQAAGVTVSAATLAAYAGAYELAPGREAVVVLEGDLLYVRGLNEPKLPLLPQSDTQFLSTATPTGFEFIKDAQGRVTAMMVRGANGDRRLPRK